MLGDNFPSTIVFAVNGERYEVSNPDPAMTVSEFLRTQTRFTGTKIGCGEGGCGICAVLLQHKNPAGTLTSVTVNACLRPLVTCDGMALVTVEGLGSQKKGFHPVQERVAKFNGSQCGFCTPGMVMALYGSLLRGRMAPSAAEVESSLDGNLCRCTGYRPILDAGKSFAPDGGVVDRVTGGAAPVGPCGADADVTPFPAFLEGYVRGPLRTTGSNRTWYRPQSLADAQALLKAHPTARIVVSRTSAGIWGTDVDDPSVFVDLNIVPELRGINAGETGVTVGAAESIAKLIETLKGTGNDVFASAAAGISRVAGTHVRNIGSIGGNLTLARTRGFESDLATILGGLGAEATFQSADGQRHKADLLEYLGKDAASPAEVLVSVHIPPPAPGTAFRTHKVALRPQNSHALVNGAFALVRGADGAVSSARLVYGGVETRAAIRARRAEEALVGAVLSNPLAPELVQRVLAGLALDIHIGEGHATRAEYRNRLVPNFLLRSLMELGGDASAAPAAPLRTHGSQAVASTAPLEFAPVGQAIPKMGAELQASGEALYTDDLEMPRSGLHAAFALTTLANAKITAIDASEARACPGVVAFLTAADIPGANNIGPFMPEPFMAAEMSLYAGMPFGIVVADTERHARYAAQKVRATYEALGEPAITSTQALAKNQMFPYFAKDYTRGDSAAALTSAALKAEGTCYGNTQQHFYMEPQTTWAAPDEDGGMRIHAASQWTGAVQMFPAKLLNIDFNKITVIQRRCGGAFGGKAFRNLPVVCAAALACHKLGRAVKMTLDRNTDMALCAGRHDVDFSYKVGFDESGTVHALDIDVLLNGGCSADASPFVSEAVARGVDESYFVPNFHVKVQVARTDLPSRTAVRGPGEIQSSFMIETVMTHVATVLHERNPSRSLGEIVHDVRTRNMYPEDPAKLISLDKKPIEPYTGLRVWEQLGRSANLAARQAAVAAFNAANKWRKRGLAATTCKYHVMGLFNDVVVGAYEDGTVRVSHTGSEIGQGIHTKVAQAVAHALSKLCGQPFPVEKVRQNDLNSDYQPSTFFTGGSTTSESACAGAVKAVEQLIERMQPVKAALEGARAKKAAEDAAAGKEAAPEKPLTPEEIFSAARSMAWNMSTSSHSTFRQSAMEGTQFEYYNFGAAASEVEVDVLTGETVIVRSDLVYDCGQSLNPAIDLGQCEGAFVQGLGYFFREQLLYDSASGRVVTNGTWEYKPPCTLDIPAEFNVEFLKDSAHKKGILSSKACGEPPLVLATSAFEAAKLAIAAARADKGLHGHFRLDAPATVDVIANACAGV